MEIINPLINVNPLVTYLDNLRKASITELHKNGKILTFGDCSMLPNIFKQPRIAAGTYGEIYNTPLKDVVVKKSINPTYNQTLIEEACMMLILNLPIFPTCYGIFKCNDGTVFIVMEKINGQSYTTWYNQTGKYIDKSELDQIKEFVLLKLTYFLYLAQSQYQFTHNDLIGQNIIIYQTEPKYEYFGDFKIWNMGYDIKIIDFGFARLQIPNTNVVFYNKVVRQRYYPNERYVPYIPSADICKIFSNPNIQTTRIKNSNFYREYMTGCNFNPYNYAVIPPFPDMDALTVLETLYTE